MKRLFIAILAAGLLAGCTTTAVTQGYRPANHAGAPWQISGTANCLSGLHTVTINGEEAIKGKLSILDCSGEATGRYQGRAVTSSCIGNGYDKVTCFVTIDNERAATLVFSL